MEVRGARVLGEAMEGDRDGGERACIHIDYPNGMLVKGGEIEHRAGADAGPLDDGTAGVARAAIVCRAGEGHCRKSLRGRIKKEDLDIVVWHETDPGATARRERAAVAPRVVGPARLHVRQRDRREDGACRVEDADGPLVVRPKVQLVGQGTVRGARVLVHVAVSYGGGGKGAQRNIENADVVGRMRREVDLAIEVRRPTVLVVATEWQRHIGKGVGGLIEEADVISAVGSEDDGRVRVGYAVVLALAQRCWEGGEGAQCHQQVRSTDRPGLQVSRWWPLAGGRRQRQHPARQGEHTCTSFTSHAAKPNYGLVWKEGHRKAVVASLSGCRSQCCAASR